MNTFIDILSILAWLNNHFSWVTWSTMAGTERVVTIHQIVFH